MTIEEQQHYQELLGDDLRTADRLAYVHGPALAGDIRALAVILRKWLLEGKLMHLSHAKGWMSSLPCLDNTQPMSVAKSLPDIEFFATGGIKFQGKSIMGVYLSDLPASKEPRLPIQGMPLVDFQVRRFLKQERIYFRPKTTFKTEEIIRFVANKQGAHVDHQRSAREREMEKAAKFVTFGCSAEKAAKQVGKTHLAMEITGDEVLDSFHVEVLAAGASFAKLRINGQQVVGD